MRKKIKLWALYWVTKHLLKALTVRDIVTVDEKTRVLFVGKEMMSEAEKHLLKGEAIQFQNMRLYSVLLQTPAHYAQEMLFKKIMNPEDIWTPKIMLHTVDIQEKIVDKLSSLK